MFMEKNHIGRGLATIGSAIVCGTMLVMTHGEHGIGWFILSLFFIW